MRIDVVGPGRSELVPEGRDGQGESVSFRHIPDVPEEGDGETDIDGEDIDDDFRLSSGHEKRRNPWISGIKRLYYTEADVIVTVLTISINISGGAFVGDRPYDRTYWGG